LQEDYRNTIAGMPEAQEGLRQERERQARLARWTEEITTYSRQWSERRDRERQGAPAKRSWWRRFLWTERPDRLARGEVVSKLEPQLPEPPATCRMWPEEEIEADCKRITENPSRLDQMQAFAGFVEQECYPLAELGTRPGFVVQHAFNNAPRGPVHNAAAQMLPAVSEPLLERRWFDRDQYNPKPAFLRTLEGHANSVNDVSMTPDGRRAVSSAGEWIPDLDSRDNTLRVWELPTGRCLRVLEGHTDDVRGVSVTPGGLCAVSASKDKTLRVWNLETGVCELVLDGHTMGINSVSVTPDGLRAVSAGDDKTVRVWNLETGVCQLVLEGHTMGINSVSVTPDGRRAVSAAGEWSPDRDKRDNALRVWDLETGFCKLVLEGHTGDVNDVCVTPDGLRAVSASDDKTLRVWDLETGRCLRVLEGHTESVWSVSVTPDGLRAVSTSHDKTLRVWALETGSCLRVLEGIGLRVRRANIAPDGRHAISADVDKALRLWNLESGRSGPSPEGHSRGVWSVSVTPDGRRGVTGSFDRTLRVWDLQGVRFLFVLEGHTDTVVSVSITPDGALAVSGSDDGKVILWDLDRGRLIEKLGGLIVNEDYGVNVSSVCLMPDGSKVVLGGHQGARVWHRESGRCWPTYTRATVDGVSVTPDGRRAILKCGTTTMVWDLGSGAMLRTLHLDGAGPISVTPDGRRAVSAGPRKTLRVWDLENWVCVRVLDGHNGRVTSVSVTPDGRYAVSGSSDKTLRVWDIENGACLGVFAAGEEIQAVAASSGLLTIGMVGGRVIVLEIHNLQPGKAIIPEASDAAYEALLRRDLDRSLREKGPDHEETRAHRTALEFLLRLMSHNTRES
jgi:WD40 repeat protein